MTQNELKELMTAREEPCISIYAPMGVHPSLARGNAICFKNLLAQAVEKLDLDWGKKSTEANELILPFQRLLKDDMFWQNQSGGLCAFVSPSFYRYYRIPLEFEESVLISDRFHFSPVLPLFTGDGQFYILSLSQHQVRFFQGTHYGLKEIILSDLPKSRDQALEAHDEEKHLQFHTRSAGNQQERDAMFHGHGTSSEDSKKNIALYLERVDQHLKQVLEGEQAPIVLAGVEYMIDFFKQTSHYKHIVDQGIIGNPDRFRPQELHDKAWPIVKNIFKEKVSHDALRFENLISKKRASNDIKEIITRAFDGKVDVLFVPHQGHIWGEFDHESYHVNVFPVKINGDDDLLELSSEQTIIHRGSIHSVKSDEIPGGSQVAAIFRQGI